MIDLLLKYNRVRLRITACDTHKNSSRSIEVQGVEGAVCSMYVL